MLEVAVIAALAMLAQDVLATLLVQAQARNKAHLAGILDVIAWILAITTTSISVTTLSGHNLTAKILVVGFVSVANYAGSVLGVKLGERYVHMTAPHRTGVRLPRHGRKPRTPKP